MYSCAVDIPSKMDGQRLKNLRGWYQIPDEFNPRLPVRGEWCCNPHFGIGVYEAYLLGGLRFPLNAFTRELLVRLGLGVCQFNPNAWRLIISMQILWREVFGGTVLLPWTSSFTIISPQKFINPLAFINSQPEVEIVD